MGGPSGGCVTASNLDLQIDYESVKRVGRDHGLGRHDRDGRDHLHGGHRPVLPGVHAEGIVRQVLPCRVGTRHMLDILTRICAGEGGKATSRSWSGSRQAVKSASLCGLGQTAPNPVLSTIRKFRHEYEEHIRQKRCRASVCEALVDAPCRTPVPAG